MKHVFGLVVVVAGLGTLSACSLWVDDQLRQASAKLADAAEGEGEGAAEGEGEGGAGEGEGEGAVDPACEDNERLVIVSSDAENPIQIYKLVPGSLVPLAPTGFVPPAGKLVKANGDPVDAVEGATFDAATGVFWVVDRSAFYAVSAITLLQVDARTPEKVVGDTGFPSFNGVTATPRFVIGVGNGLDGMDRQGAVASPPVALQSSGSFHSAITFTHAGVTYVAANAIHGYQVLATTDPNGQPAAAAGIDDDTRFGDFGGGQARRGLAYDNASGSLLLGDDDGVIVPKADAGFSLPDATTDYVLPHGSFVTALGGRGGKGYVANESGDVYEIDLSVQPPTTVQVSTWDSFNTAGTPQQLLVGCKRAILVVGGFGGTTIFQYDRDTLAAFGGGPEVHGIIDAILVDKTALGLAGDN